MCLVRGQVRLSNHKNHHICVAKNYQGLPTSRQGEPLVAEVVSWAFVVAVLAAVLAQVKTLITVTTTKALAAKFSDSN